MLSSTTPSEPRAGSSSFTTERFLYGSSRKKKSFHVVPVNSGAATARVASSDQLHPPHPLELPQVVGQERVSTGWKASDAAAVAKSVDARNYHDAFNEYTKTPIDVYKKKPALRAPLLLPAPANFNAAPYHDFKEELEDSNAKAHLNFSLEQCKKQNYDLRKDIARLTHQLHVSQEGSNDLSKRLLTCAADRDQNIQRVKEVTNACQKLQVRVGSLEEHIQQLQAANNTAEQIVREVRANEANVAAAFQAQIDQRSQKISELEQVIFDKTIETEKLQSDLDVMKKAKAYEFKVGQETKAALNKLKTEFRACEKILVETKAQCKRETNELSSQLQKLTAQHRTLTESFEKAQETIASMKEKNETLDGRLKGLIEQSNVDAATIQDLKTLLNETTFSLEQCEKFKAEEITKKKNLQKELEDMTEQYTSTAAELSATESTLQQTTDTLAKVRAEYEDLHNTSATTIRMLKDELETARESMEVEQPNMDNMRNQLKSVIANAKKKQESLEGDVEDLKDIAAKEQEKMAKDKTRMALAMEKLSSQKDRMQEQLAMKTEEVDSLNEELEQANNEVSTCRDRIRTLEIDFGNFKNRHKDCAKKLAEAEALAAAHATAAAAPPAAEVPKPSATPEPEEEGKKMQEYVTKEVFEDERKKVNTQAKKINKLEGKVEKYKTEARETKAVLKEMQKKVLQNASTAESADKADGTIKALKWQINQLEERCEEMPAKEAEIDRLTAQVADLSDVEAQLFGLNEEKTALQKQVEDLEKAIAQETEKASSFEKINMTFMANQTQLSAKVGSLEEMKQRCETAEKEVKRLSALDNVQGADRQKAELESLQKEHADLRDKNIEVASALEREMRKTGELEEEVKALKVQQDKSNTLIKSMEDSLQEAGSEGEESQITRTKLKKLELFLENKIAAVVEAGMTLSEQQGKLKGLVLQDSLRGVQIESVEVGSAADAADLCDGDVILQIDGKDVNSEKEWNKALQKRAGEQLWLTVLKGEETCCLGVVVGADSMDNDDLQALRRTANYRVEDFEF